VPLVNRIALLDIAPPLIALCVRLMASHRCVPTIDSAALSIDSTVQSLVGTVLSIGNNHTDMHNCLQRSSVGLSISEHYWSIVAQTSDRSTAQHNRLMAQIGRSRMSYTPESDFGMDMGVPVGEVVTSVGVKRVVKDDQEVLITTMIVHVDTRVHLRCL